MAIINGTGASETLRGGSRDDSITGNGGNDTIVGGAGSDTLWGGLGNDTFVFESTVGANGVDTIKDYKYNKSGEFDVLDLSLLLGSLSSRVSITPYIDLRAVGGSTQVWIDKDGTGTRFGMQQAALLDGVSGLDQVRVKYGSVFQTLTVPKVGPQIQSIAITGSTGASSSLLNTGDTVSVTVTFDEVVNVVTTGGTPSLNLNIGGTTKAASYASGTGTSALIFTYTIESSLNDTDGISIDAGSVALNGGTIKNISAQDAASLAFLAVAANSSYKVDTTTPEPLASTPVVLSYTGELNNTLNAGDKVTVTVTFTESVTVDTTSGTPSIALSIGDATKAATYASGTGTTALVFEYTIESSLTDTDGITVGSLSLNSGTIKDAAGNSATFSYAAVTGHKVDTTAPAVTLSFAERSNSGSEGVNVTVNADETTSSVSVANESVTSPNFYFTSGTYGSVKGTATDLAGNSSDSSTYKLVVGNIINDTLNVGGSTASIIYGLAGNDAITGSSTADSIYGGAGADTIIGAAGADVIQGGASSDSFQFAAGSSNTVAGSGPNNAFGQDSITDFAAGDFIEITGTISTSFTITTDILVGTGTATGANGAISSADNFLTKTYLANLSADPGYELALSITTDGTTRAFTTNAQAQAATVFNVTLGSTADMVAGANSDRIIGGSGVNNITGGAGADYMSGAGGADIYIFGDGSTAVATAGGASTSTATLDIVNVNTADNDKITLAALETKNSYDNFTKITNGGNISLTVSAGSTPNAGTVSLIMGVYDSSANTFTSSGITANWNAALISFADADAQTTATHSIVVTGVTSDTDFSISNGSITI